MKKVILILSILIFVIGCKNYTKAVDVVSAQQLEEVIRNETNIQLIDVRTLKEYNEGSIKGAINIDIKNLKSFKEQAGKLNKQESVYVYCQKGGRSNKACRILNELGFEKIFDYAGGYSEWSTLNK